MFLLNNHEILSALIIGVCSVIAAIIGLWRWNKGRRKPENDYDPNLDIKFEQSSKGTKISISQSRPLLNDNQESPG